MGRPSRVDASAPYGDASRPRTPVSVHLLLQLWAGLLALGVGFCTKDARADAADSTRIIVVMDRPAQSLATRIATELGTMGFEAVVVLVDGEAPEGLPDITRREQGVAGARIVLSSDTVRLWLLDRTTGKTLMRELERDTTTQEARLAVHTVELLRASLLELELPDAPQGELRASQSLLAAARVPRPAASAAGSHVQDPASGTADASGVAPAPREPHPSSENAEHADPFLSVEVGPAVVGAQGDLEPFLALAARVAWFALPELRFGVSSFVPLTGMSHEAAEGSSESRVTLIGVDTRWQATHGVLHPSVGLGLMLGHLQTRGQAAWSSLESGSDQATGVGGSLSAGIGVRLSSHLYLTPQANAGVQFAYFVIDYGERGAASWGPFWWAGSITLEGRLE